MSEDSLSDIWSQIIVATRDRDSSSQGSADRPYNNEIVIISPNEAKSLSKGLLNLGNITKVVSNRGKAKM